MAKGKKVTEHLLPEVRRARFDRLTIYEVSEEELDILAQGSVESTLFNFAVFTASVFVSFLVSLLSTTIPSERTFTVFVVITAISGLASSLLFVVWLRTRRSVRAIIQRIRDRLSPQGIQQTGRIDLINALPSASEVAAPKQLESAEPEDADDVKAPRQSR